MLCTFLWFVLIALEGIYTHNVAMSTAAGANQGTSPLHKFPRVGEAFEPWDNDSLQQRGDGAFSQPPGGSGVPPLPLRFGQSSLEEQVSKLTLLVAELAKMQMQHVQATSSTAAPRGPAEMVSASVPPGQVSQRVAENLSGAGHVPMEQDGDPVALYIDSLKKKGVKLPNELLMKMKSESAKFGKLLKNLSRTKTHRQKLEKRLAELLAGRIPLGIKPWKCNDESPIWRLPLGDEAAATMPFKITGEDAIERVKATLSVEFHACNTVVDLRYRWSLSKVVQSACSSPNVLRLQSPSTRASPTRHQALEFLLGFVMVG